MFDPIRRRCEFLQDTPISSDSAGAIDESHPVIFDAVRWLEAYIRKSRLQVLCHTSSLSEGETVSLAITIVVGSRYGTYE